jgi:predicted esterase
MAHVNTLTL